MGIYNEIEIVHVPRMRIASYVMISPAPEKDVISYMDQWAKNCGLLDKEGYIPRRIGWDFPFVSIEQSEHFGLRGYVCAYVIPEDYESTCCGAEISNIEEGNYAKLTIADPHNESLENVAQGYALLLSFINNSKYETELTIGRSCFEEEYDRDGVHYMDIFVPVV
ncbi:GyrI-like domain-containing protein [Brevibacillus daliensis]|uniref:GyrI-like domain-containing protein n=1 Tax=Brevibacillus daliensis TaxID=2892995 RepID=UPI001E3171AF|nr:GyrI-like domain-containing protein [Brevibacillus daliensis]